MGSGFKYIGIALVAAAGLSGSAAAAADIAHGADVAKRWCTGCHAVTAGQKQVNADVRSFAAIAASPNYSGEKLAFFLLDPHPKMPNFSLTRAEATDLAAYIGSLRQ